MQRIVVVEPTGEQGHERAEADAADADDLERVVREPISIEQDAQVLLKRLAIRRRPESASGRVMSDGA